MPTSLFIFTESLDLNIVGGSDSVRGLNVEVLWVGAYIASYQPAEKD